MTDLHHAALLVVGVVKHIRIAVKNRSDAVSAKASNRRESERSNIVLDNFSEVAVEEARLDLIAFVSE